MDGTRIDSSVHARLDHLDQIARQLVTSRSDLQTLQTLQADLHRKLRHARMTVRLVEGFIRYRAARELTHDDSLALD